MDILGHGTMSQSLTSSLTFMIHAPNYSSILEQAYQLKKKHYEAFFHHIIRR
jgi:hypothetical protein